MDLFLPAVLGDLASRSILYYDACIDAYDAWQVMFNVEMEILW